MRELTRLRRGLVCLAFVAAATSVAACGEDEPTEQDKRCAQIAEGANRAAKSYMDDAPIGDDFDPEQALSDYDDFVEFERECMD